MGEKHQWSNEQIKCLLETCIDEINSVGKRGLSLHKDSWNKLGRVLKEKFGMDLSQKQLKNAFDNLKAKYIGCGHPKAASLRTSSLPFPDLCAALFDGNAATGNCKWSSTQTTSIVGSSSIHRVQQFLLMDTEDDAGTSQHNTPDPTADPSFETTREPSPEPTREPSPEPNPSKRPRTSKSSSISADDLANDMKKVLQYLIKGKEGPTVLECSEKLKLVGLDPVDTLFLAAYHIFGVSTGMRGAWMALPDIPEVLKGWLAMTAGSLGLIK
ncbi:hypothetical protein R6Q57_015682 [Mikania cordata]